MATTIEPSEWICVAKPQADLAYRKQLLNHTVVDLAKTSPDVTWAEISKSETRFEDVFLRITYRISVPLRKLLKGLPISGMCVLDQVKTSRLWHSLGPGMCDT